MHSIHQLIQCLMNYQLFNITITNNYTSIFCQEYSQRSVQNTPFPQQLPLYPNLPRWWHQGHLNPWDCSPTPAVLVTHIYKQKELSTGAAPDLQSPQNLWLRLTFLRYQLCPVVSAVFDLQSLCLHTIFLQTSSLPYRGNPDLLC